MAAARFVVSGRVQGVGFRYFVRTRARAAGLAGWVRNCADGRVEACAAGSEGALREFEQWLKAGPPGSHVESVSREGTQDEAPLPDPFDIVR